MALKEIFSLLERDLGAVDVRGRWVVFIIERRFFFEFLYDEGVPIDPPVIVPRVPHHKAKVKKPNYLPEHAGVGGMWEGIN